MSKESFISETQRYLDNRNAELNRSISVLQNISSGVDSAYGSLRSRLLDNIRSLVTPFGSYNDSSAVFESHVDGVVSEVLGGNSASEGGLRQSRGVISILGSILSTEKTTPHYLAKKTADDLTLKLQDRTSVLDDISYYLGRAKSEIALIDSSWYEDYLIDTTNALNDVNNAIENMITVRAFVHEQDAVNDEKIDLVKSNVSSAIGHLSRVNSPVSVLNITSYAEKLTALNARLALLDEEINVYISNLIEFKTSFNDSEDAGNRFISYVRESVEHQYNDLLSVKALMREVLNRGDSRLALEQAPDWIKRLSTIGALSDEQIIDFGESLNDSSNLETIKLDTLITQLGMTSLNISISSDIEETIGLISRVINVAIDSTEVMSNIDSMITDVEVDTTASRQVIFDCSDYEPTPIEALDEFLRYIETLDLDRLKYVLLSSDWGQIFTLVENGLTHSEVISMFIVPFIDDIEDDELRNSILHLAYKMQSERRINRVKAITFDTAATHALNALRTGRVRELEQMTGQLETISRRLQ